MSSISKLFAFCAVSGLFGCMSTVAVQSPVPPPESPFVEAYFEYPGPPNRWAGPQSLLIQLTARDPGASKVVVTPSVLDSGQVLDTAQPIESAFERATSETARAQLKELAAAARADSSNFSGCLYPTRLRLVRADGTFVERSGCRGQSGWPIAMSRTVSQVIETALNERQKFGAPNRAISSSRALSSSETTVKSSTVR